MMRSALLALAPWYSSQDWIRLDRLRPDVSQGNVRIKHGSISNADPPFRSGRIIAKNRNGEPGTVELSWIGSQTKFAEIEFQRPEK